MLSRKNPMRFVTLSERRASAIVVDPDHVVGLQEPDRLVREPRIHAPVGVVAYIRARHGGLTFMRNGRGGAPVNFAENCVDSRFLPRRCARTNTRRVSPRGYTASGTGRSTTRA